jgi:hypothetical protein
MPENTVLENKIQVSQHPYRTRNVEFLELWEWFGWRIKVYGINHPSQALIDATKVKARERLPLPAVTSDRYGIGYIIVHQGAVGNYGFVNWWTGQDIVQHHLYGAPKGQALRYQYPEGAGYCVWELAVCWFERQAWVQTVLATGEPTDFKAYLECRMKADV